MPDRLRIVHICQSYMDGMGYQENYLPRYQALLGHDVTLVTSTQYPVYRGTALPRVAPGAYADHGVKIVRLRTASVVVLGRNRLVFMFGLYSALDRAKPDVIFHHGTADTALRAATTYKSRHPSTRLVLDSHADYKNSGGSWISLRLWHGWYWRRRLQGALPLVDKVFAITPACSRFEQEVHKVPEGLIELLPLGCDDNDLPPRDAARVWLRQKARWPMDARVVITAGKLDRGKRTVETVRAFRMLSGGAVRMAIVGAVGPDISQDLCDAIAGDTRIGLFGWVSADELAWWLRGADIGVWPGSESAIWVQAVGSGLPIILRHVWGREDLTSGDNGILLESSEPDEIHRCLKIALDGAFLAKLTQSAAEVAARFSYTTIARQSLAFASVPETLQPEILQPEIRVKQGQDSASMPHA